VAANENSMSWVHEHRFPDSLALAHALSGEIKVDLEEAIQERGAASLVVSGGRTPARLFEQLRSESLDWSKVWVTLADERWVETTAAASNEKLVRETLLTGPAAAAHFVALKNPAPAPEAGADWATRALTRVPHPFDVVLLGMGEGAGPVGPAGVCRHQFVDGTACAAQLESVGVAGLAPYYFAYRGGVEVAGLSARESGGAGGRVASALGAAPERSAHGRVLVALMSLRT
jgi:hypothetical protein